MKTITYSVPNINCGHCVHTIQTEVSDLQGVTVGEGRCGYQASRDQLRRPRLRGADQVAAGRDQLSCRSLRPLLTTESQSSQSFISIFCDQLVLFSWKDVITVLSGHRIMITLLTSLEYLTCSTL